jgi:uncharacterized integral membrane protein
MTDQVSSGPQNPRIGSPRTGATSGRGKSLFTRVSAAWVAIGAALALLVLMIVFMLQNSTRTDFHYLGLTASLPLGLAMVIAAVGGGLVVAIAGTARITQLRKDARRRQQPPP